jgi:imidazolonepropionase
VFGGNRAIEAERRLQGASYEQIAREGGGIVSTVRATRALDEDGLYAASLPRAAALVADGVGTIEVKSGYGLDLESEARMLRVARRLGTELGVDVRTTFLGAHALPPEYAGRADDYVEAACGWLRANCRRRAWSTRSTPSAKASASARRRRGACSKPRARSACR